MELVKLAPHTCAHLMLSHEAQLGHETGLIPQHFLAGNHIVAEFINGQIPV
jgi:hypothetical protein